MLIEIHMIQNHSPSNLNRDDLGAPKTCIFGGVTRARISSQCLKRSIRRSPEFAAALEKDGGVRTRRLIEAISTAASGEGNPHDEKQIKAVGKVFQEGGVELKKDENTLGILFFLPRSAIDEMGQALAANSKDLGARFAEIMGKFAKAPDIALCGRMTEFDAKGPFAGLKGKFKVEAALSAAHAISTHAVINEVDYFTAADDIPGEDAGAGHVDEAMFNSACFYKHFSIDWDQLVANLNGDVELAATTVKCFLEGAAKTNPSGKQHAYAAFNCPDGILVEVKTKMATPLSYANAFADPVRERSEKGLIGESVRHLGQYVHEVCEGYGIDAKRLWFSPSNRFQLTYKEGNQEIPVIEGDDGNIGKFDELVKRVTDTMRTASPAGAGS